MDCYKDRTFCSFHQNCIDGEICLRALTEEVKRAAIKADLPVAQYVEAPRCFNEKRKRTHMGMYGISCIRKNRNARKL